MEDNTNHTFLIWNGKDKKPRSLEEPTKTLTGWSKAKFSLDECLEAIKDRPGYGIGFSFHGADEDIVGLDFDAVRNPLNGSIDSQVDALIEMLRGKAFADVSCSGSGLKFIFKVSGDIAKLAKMKKTVLTLEGDGFGDHSPHVELFKASKQFALTGTRFEDFEGVDSWTDQERFNELVADMEPVELSQLLELMGLDKSKTKKAQIEPAALEIKLKWPDEAVETLFRGILSECPDAFGSYDQWRNMLFAIQYHYGEGRRDEGLALATEISEASPNYDGADRVEEVYDTASDNIEAAGAVKPKTFLNKLNGLDVAGYDMPELSQKVQELLAESNSKEIIALSMSKILTQQLVAELVADRFRDSAFRVISGDAFTFFTREPDNTAVRRGSTRLGAVLEDKARKVLIKLTKEVAATSTNEKGVHPLIRFEDISIRNRTAKAAIEELDTFDEEQIDADHDILNVLNGELLLSTGELRPRRDDHLNTRVALINFDKSATSCPVWMSHLNFCFPDEPETIEWLQMVLAAGLRRGNPLGKLVLFLGEGKNGKTVILRTLSEILNGTETARSEDRVLRYAHKVDKVLFMAGKESEAQKRRAELQGKHFFYTEELSSAKFDEASIKSFVDVDRVYVDVRLAYENAKQIEIIGNGIIAANTRPKITGSDDGIWRRMDLLMFEQELSESDIDRQFQDKLRPEYPAILNWLLEGSRKLDALLAKGEEPRCKRVTEETQAWRGAVDVLSQVMAQNFVEEEGGRVVLGEVMAAYNRHREAESGLHSKTLANRLRKRGFKTEKAGGKTYVIGYSDKYGSFSGGA